MIPKDHKVMPYFAQHLLAGYFRYNVLLLEYQLISLPTIQ